MLEQLIEISECRDPLVSLRQEMRERLESYQNESAAMASFERFSGLNRKTLKGFLDGKRVPYSSTLVRFCKWIHKVQDEKEALLKIGPELRTYLINHGYNMTAEKKDITWLIAKSTIHFELYMMTEDHQLIKRSEISEIYGKRGLEALNELLLEGVLQSLDENTCTAGTIRAARDNNYYKASARLMNELFPWDETEKNPNFSDAGLSLGNIVVSKSDEEQINKVFAELNRKLCDLHDKGMKEKVENRLRFVYSTAVYRPITERGL